MYLNTKTQYYNNHLHVGSPDKSGGYHTIKTNYYMMKNIVFITSMFFFLLSLSCSKEEKSDRFRLLTAPVWETDSLLVNSVDASGPGEMLADFAGEAKFNEDETGTISAKLKISLAIKNLTNTEYMGRPGDIQAQRNYTLRLSGKL